ncbi:unnamed protein product, partial [Tenebrio molitor]
MKNIEIIPMEVADVLDNQFYLLKSLDRTQEYKMPCGLIDMNDGTLVAIGENKYIKLIIPDENADLPEPLPEPTQDNIGKIPTGTTDRHVWNYDETICLINSMTTNMEDLNHARKRRYVFENVSNDLLSNGFTVSSYACQSK